MPLWIRVRCMSYLICKGNYNSHILLPVSFVYVDLRKEPAQVAVILGFLFFILHFFPTEGVLIYLVSVAVYTSVVLHSHYFQRACGYTFAAFYAVGVKITCCCTTAVVWRELHRANSGTALALHLTCVGTVDIGKAGGQRGLFWRYTRR